MGSGKMPGSPSTMLWRMRPVSPSANDCGGRAQFPEVVASLHLARTGNERAHSEKAFTFAHHRSQDASIALDAFGLWSVHHDAAIYFLHHVQYDRSNRDAPTNQLILVGTVNEDVRTEPADGPGRETGRREDRHLRSSGVVPDTGGTTPDVPLPRLVLGVHREVVLRLPAPASEGSAGADVDNCEPPIPLEPDTRNHGPAHRLSLRRRHRISPNFADDHTADLSASSRARRSATSVSSSCEGTPAACHVDTNERPRTQNDQ